jgi:ABC-type transporter Mla subunit MlaD
MSRFPEPARRQLIGIAVGLLGVLLLLVAFTGHVPLSGGDGGTSVTARFAQANQIDDSTPPILTGVEVGHVVSLTPAPGNTTTVEMRITGSGVHLHFDAGAEIRWRTLLGGSMYIDLRPGSPSTPPLATEIALTRTRSQVDWDQFNAQLPAAARPQLQRELAGLDQALQAPGPEGSTVRVFGPAAATIGHSAEALRGQQIGDLPQLIETTASTVKALGSDSAGLERLVDGADRTLAVTAAHNTALAHAIQLSQPALDATLSTNRTLDRTLTALDPLVVRLEPGARLLGPTNAVLAPLLAQANRTLNDAVPLLKVAPGALRALGYASRHGTPLIAGLTPTVDRLNRDLIPLLARTDPDTRLRLYETFGPLASALSSSMSGFDANGWVYNFNVQLSTGSFVLPCDTGPGGTSNVGSCLTQRPPYARTKR